MAIVAALIRRGDEVLMVQQQGPNDPAPGWALPGGVVEPGERLLQALAREVREETGLAIGDAGQLLYVAEYGEDSGPYGVAFVFEVTAWEGDLQPADPDEFILDARFLPLADAVARLETLPWRRMWEPIVAYLRGDVERGATWCYRRRPVREDELIARLAHLPARRGP
jgi:8-oxo-dGTP diphosphatase